MLPEAVTIGAYGKLPLSREYLRVRSHDGVGRQLRHWLDAAFEKHGGGGGRIGKWRLLFRFDGENEAGVATLQDSSDGQRAFPFMCFARLPTRDPTVQLLAQHQALWNDLEQCTASAAARADAAGFIATVQGWTVESNGADTAPRIAQLSLTEFAEALAPPGGLAGFLWGLRDAILRLKQAGSGAMPTLRIPMAAGLDCSEQAQVWLEFLHCNGLRGLDCASLALPVEGGPGASLWILMRDPVAADYALLGSSAEGFLVPASKADGRAQLGYRVFQAEVEQTLLRPEVSVRDMMEYSVL